MMREPIGAGVELAATELSAVENDGDRVRPVAGLRCRQLMHAPIERVVAASIIPFDQDALALGRGQQRQLGEALLGRGRRARQQLLEMFGQCADRSALEQLGSVFDLRRQRAVRLGHRQPHVAFGGFRVQRYLAQHRSLQLQPGIRQRLQGKGHRVQSVAPQVRGQAELGDQPVGGDLLMLVRFQHRSARAGEHLTELRVAAQVGPHDQGVGEEPDGAMETGAQPPGDRRADRHVIAAAIAQQQRLKRREQHHEQRAVVRARKRLELLHQRGRYAEALDFSPQGQLRAARMICRQLGRLETGQAVAPVPQVSGRGR